MNDMIEVTSEGERVLIRRNQIAAVAMRDGEPGCIILLVNVETPFQVKESYDEVARKLGFIVEED